MLSDVLEKPFGLIPAGTGNGLSQTLNGLVDPAVATAAIIKGAVVPLDLFAVRQRDAAGVLRTFWRFRPNGARRRLGC